MKLTRPLVIALAFIAAAFAVGLWAYLRLPPDARIAVHFAANGQPNGYASKVMGLFILPSITALVTLVLAFAPRIVPPPKDITAWEAAYGIVVASVAGVMFAAEAAIVAHAMDPTFDVLRAVFLATGVMLVVVGNFLGKIRQNWLIGIRTRWTLANARVWDKTHRFTGRLMVAAGLVLTPLSVLVPDHRLLLALVVACAVGPAIAGAFYSWRIFAANRPA